MTILSLLIFIGILFLVILVHELGHFVTAKLRGVKVHEFGIGFPPRLFAFKRGETEYSLNIIPLGGFVRMAGELDPDEDGRGLTDKGYGTRLLVLAAGSIMNLLLPIALLITAFAIPMQLGEGVEISDVVEPSPAAIAGVQDGDLILEANGVTITTFDDLNQVIAKANPNLPVVLQLEREGLPVEKTVNPPYLDDGKIGVMLTWAGSVTKTYSPWQAISLGFTEMGRIYAGLGEFFVDLVTGQASLDVRGPVGIADATAEVIRYGASAVLVWAALISISIGIINLMPLPVFDGGHILFLFIEWIRRGKRISLRKRTYIQIVSWLLVMGLFIAVTYTDILRVISGESIFP